MEFPELLSAILYNDCSAQIEREFPRLKALAQANGSNTALLMTLNYFNQTKKSPTPEQLRDYAPSQPKTTLEHVLPDLEQAADWRKACSAGSFELAIDNAWREANRNYVDHAYRAAVGIATAGMVPPDLKTYQFEKRMKALYGEDEAAWDRTEFSQLWLNEYLAKNPFVQKEAEEDLGDTLVSSSRVLDENQAMVTKNIYVKCLDEVPDEDLLWLWENKIPLGKVTWFVGKPSNGKSMSAIDVIARVTTGRDWPDGEKNPWGPASVYLVSSEDELSDTIKPRLRAAGADTKRVFTFTRASENGSKRSIDLVKDIKQLESILRADPTFRLLVFDPLPSFLAGVNLNITEEARPVMDALKELCSKTSVSLLGIIHENKRSDVGAVQKVPGDAAVSGVARVAWSFTRDTEDKEKFRMTWIKGNVSKKRTGLSFRIEDKELSGLKKKQPFIAWGCEIDEDADDVLKSERDARYEKRDDKMSTIARVWLPEKLRGGPRKEKELMEAAELEEGISKWQLRRVKNELHVISARRGKEWWWSMPRSEPEIPGAEVL